MNFEVRYIPTVVRGPTIRFRGGQIGVARPEHIDPITGERYTNFLDEICVSRYDIQVTGSWHINDPQSFAQARAEAVEAHAALSRAAAERMGIDHLDQVARKLVASYRPQPRL